MEKRGGWKTSRMTPLPRRGFGHPLVRYVFHPLRCQCSVFPVQMSTTEQTRSSFGGVQKFPGERILWYVFLPPYVLHPPISWPKLPKEPCRTKITIRHENITYPKKLFSNEFPITVSRFRFLRMNFRKLPDTYCMCVSCVTLPSWDPCPCRIIFYYRYPI